MTKKDTSESKRWLDNPVNVKNFLKLFFGLCGICLVVDLIYSFVSHKHHAFYEEGTIRSMEAFPMFYGLYGFLACVLLILVSKMMRSINGKRILMRDEDYWEK
jgi:uncharacterized membrane protein|tara:strand:+ start:166 stop:474 length:309 start_codon:yes stop_codon:yes gene_type:complete